MRLYQQRVECFQYCKSFFTVLISFSHQSVDSLGEHGLGRCEVKLGLLESSHHVTMLEVKEIGQSLSKLYLCLFAKLRQVSRAFLEREEVVKSLNHVDNCKLVHSSSKLELHAVIEYLEHKHEASVVVSSLLFRA